MPNRIKVDNIIYRYENWEKFYYTDNEAREDLLVKGKDYSTNDFLNWNVELIEEPQDIDIQAIEEIDNITPFYNYHLTINKLIQAVKQLDININKKYCEVCGVELDKNNTALPNMCWECKYGKEQQ